MGGLGIASLILGGLSTAFQSYGMYQQARAAQHRAEYQAKVARNNQIIAQREAEERRREGREQEQIHRRKVNALAGRQRAVMAAQGVDLGTTGDTSEDILADTAFLGEIDAQRIRYNAERAAYGEEIQATNLGYQADLYDAAADQYSPVRTGLTSLLAGAGSVAAQWYRWQNTTPANLGATG